MLTIKDNGNRYGSAMGRFVRSVVGVPNTYSDLVVHPSINRTAIGYVEPPISGRGFGRSRGNGKALGSCASSQGWSKIVVWLSCCSYAVQHDG